MFRLAMEHHRLDGVLGVVNHGLHSLKTCTSRKQDDPANERQEFALPVLAEFCWVTAWQ